MFGGYRVSIIPITQSVPKSKYVTGDATVGIVDKIPNEGVCMLLGNDLAGEQVDICPVLCLQPVIDKTCKLSVEESEWYLKCVVTRSM